MRCSGGLLGQKDSVTGRNYVGLTFRPFLDTKVFPVHRPIGYRRCDGNIFVFFKSF